MTPCTHSRSLTRAQTLDHYIANACAPHGHPTHNTIAIDGVGRADKALLWRATAKNAGPPHTSRAARSGNRGLHLRRGRLERIHLVVHRCELGQDKVELGVETDALALARELPVRAFSSSKHWLRPSSIALPSSPSSRSSVTFSSSSLYSRAQSSPNRSPSSTVPRSFSGPSPASPTLSRATGA